MPEIEKTITLDELRRKQLARLKGEIPSAATPEFSIPDAKLDDEYFAYAARQEKGNWPVQDREIWEAEHRAMLETERNRKQPENKLEPQPFQVGQPTGEWYPRAAIPAPKWPEPGALLTREIVKSHDAELDLYQRANRALQDVTWWTRTRLLEPDYWNAEHNGNMQTRFAETIAWLSGIWQGRGIQPPTEIQIEKWARDWNKTHQARPTKDVHTEQTDESS
jgi:hypothetical protein